MSATDLPEPNEAPSATQYHILGTAGHIDHGKTSLVRALTGVDTDRLPEEQLRGMTIELGFADLTIEKMRFGIVDVPGHERFVKTMVAGATGIDMTLLVVAADDSVMPQTIEHVEILNLLGVRRGVVAITKIDLVDPEMVELVVDEVTELLATTHLAEAPIRLVSSTTGAGIEALKETLSDVARQIEPASSRWPFRMTVDRVFTVQGRGTVVTGSALRGSVSAGDTLEVWPGGRTCRVRGLQTHGVHQDSLMRRQRVAINVSGIDRAHVPRGSELATPEYLTASRLVDVRLTCLPSCPRPLKSTSTVRLGVGTTEVPVRVVLLGRSVLEPGQSGYAQLRSGQALTTTYGQRFILRDETAVRTIGGGVVLRPVAGRKRREVRAEIDALEKLEHGRGADRVEDVLRCAGFTTAPDLKVCAWAGVETDELPDLYQRLRSEKRLIPVPGTAVFVTPAAVADLAHRLSGWLSRFHRSHPDEPGRSVDTVLGWLERMTDRSMARSLLDQFIEEGKIKRVGRFACLAEFAPTLSSADEKLLLAMVDEIRAGGFQPPSPADMVCTAGAERKRWERLATFAVALGELVKIDAKIFLHAEVERSLRETVAALIGEKGEVTVAEVREAVASSRKFVVPFLEYLDRVGFTRRMGDGRVLASSTGA